MRLDQYVHAAWPEYSRSTWQKYILKGYVLVNGQSVLLTKYNVKETDAVTRDIKEAEISDEHTIETIYEDDNVIVINKPVGILSHSKGSINEEFTVADFFKSKKTTYNAETNRPGIIHRLDRDTSGVMIGVKNAETARLLQKQFQDRKTKKTYMAIVDGVPKNDEAILDLPIGRNPKKPSTFRVDSNGKSAETRYAIEEVVGDKSLVRLMPKTGRTHQLRVHMAYLNTPIRGDRVYGKESSRLFLHALQLEITIPTSNRQVFTAPVPVEFEKEMRT
jgi:23S rRNA pseudouridine1911/1915/1917 synthase